MFQTADDARKNSKGFALDIVKEKVAEAVRLGRGDTSVHHSFGPEVLEHVVDTFWGWGYVVEKEPGSLRISW